MYVLQRARVLALLVSAMFTGGCATQLQQERGPMAGASPCTFWPPPPSTSILVAGGAAARDATLGDVADRATALLGDAGYDDVRWYPIGVGFQHGFALVTRLEDIQAVPDRWAASDREPPTLRWLAGARQPRFSRAGRYRALLFSFTDLPLPSNATADPWDEGTVMEGPGIPVDMRVGDVPKRWRVPNTFRWLLFSYEYEATGANIDARFVETGEASGRPDPGGGASIPNLARDLGLPPREAR